ncbi:Hexosyltransferase [Rhynchospora pubera]|uniref:Hexosyltransferase n=1 Tax=Rhynchospora pubera TaxID=906938 RepID=A0AAV8CT94_9POAL|nr:Hexosyltransferase [Rhynchospora pubera]
MKGGLMGLFPSPLETRHRLNDYSEDDDSKKRCQRGGKVSKEIERLNLLILERSSTCKFQPLKIVLFSLICVALLTFICSPSVHQELQLPSTRFVDVGWIWDRPLIDPRYKSDKKIQWHDLFSTIDQTLSPSKTNQLKVALLNFNLTETRYWSHSIPNSQISTVKLDPLPNSITWQTLYPEWIDEEELTEIPTCPTFPDPVPPKKIGLAFDLIAVKLPCDRSITWSRDVVRLHLQLSAAKLAVRFGSRSKNGDNKHKRVHVLFVSDCLPIPNLFNCKDRVKREGNLWLYQPDLTMLRQKIRLPVGSCELALPLKTKARLYSVDKKREAYATILHSAQLYVCGAIVAAQSIRQAGSTRDLIILVDESISSEHRAGLQSAGWQVRTIKRIRNPKAERDAYNEWNYSKFRLWQLTDYDKIIFIDADMLIMRNIDFLFAMPEITATGNNATLFNSGVMVIEPSNCTFELLMENINDIQSYNGGDQGYLNEIFTWWHRIPKHMNFLKHFWEGDEESVKAKKSGFLRPTRQSYTFCTI